MTGKVYSIAISDKFVKLFTNYFKLRVQKYGDFLLNCTKLPLIVLCWNLNRRYGEQILK